MISPTLNGEDEPQSACPAPVGSLLRLSPGVQAKEENFQTAHKIESHIIPDQRHKEKQTPGPAGHPASTSPISSSRDKQVLFYLPHLRAGIEIVFEENPEK